MGRDILNKRIPGCTLKHYEDMNADISREACVPRYCKHSSESERQSDPVCQVVRRKIADLERCPLIKTGRKSGVQDTEQISMLDRVIWTKTKN